MYCVCYLQGAIEPGAAALAQSNALANFASWPIELLSPQQAWLVQQLGQALANQVKQAPL
jgi:hypothetical protein